MDEVLTDEDVPHPSAYECRVPAEWQQIMSAGTLRQAKPPTMEELLASCSQAIEAVASAQLAEAGGGSDVSAPQLVWEHLTGQMAYKAAEGALASTIAGVMPPARA